MAKKLRQLDQFLKKNSSARRAKDAMLRRIMPEYFVDQKLRQFEEFNTRERAYVDTVENFLQTERANRIEDINRAIVKNIQNDFKHNDLSRIVRAKFSTDPLCSVGSIKRPPGGRFNFGQTTRLSTNYFQALYLASDYNTAFAESFHSENESIGSFAHFKVSVKIDRYLDLRKNDVISDFFKVIKDIELPEEYIKLARQLGVEPMSLCKVESELRGAIFSEKYKAWDTWVDQYAPSQWFGYYAYELGIPAIVYPSVRDEDGFNLAVFTEKFEETDCIVELKDSEQWTAIRGDRKQITSNNFEPLLNSIFD